MVENPTQNQEGQTQVSADDLLKMIGLLTVQNQAIRETAQVLNTQLGQLQEKYKSKELELAEAYKKIEELSKGREGSSE